MKNQKLFKTLAFALIVVVLAITMSACMKEEDYYTKSDVESLIETLETKLLDNKTELDVKIDELKAEYEAKVTELQIKDSENKAALEALEAEYTAKVTELEASDKANADALATLKAEYEAKVTELNGLISANSAKIVALETELNGKIADAKSDYEAKISGISELITALQNADTENVKKVAALEAKVEEILARHEHSFGEWFDFENNDDVFCENRVFYHVCEECNVMELKRGSYENHKFLTVTTPPTCVSGGYDTKTCEICGKTERLNETPTTDHTWKTEYSNDNSFHWFDCEYCDADNAKAEHNIDELGCCTVCEAPLAPSEGIIYDLSADKTYAEVIGYTGAATKINIASEYNGVPVKSIHKEVFKNSKITSVVIPDSVTSIGESAFFNCRSLTSVVIGDSVTSIGNYAFYNCDSLTSVVIPDSVTSIGEEAFYNCDSLRSVEIGDSITSIGYGAFYGCNSKLYTEYEYGKYVGNAENPYAILIEVTNKNLLTYKIHESTKIIAYRVFTPCERLTSITIPDSVTSIGYSAFYECMSLTSVVIGDSVTSIGNSAFSSCSSLTSLVIGDSVTSIGTFAFSSCSSLTSLEIGDSVLSLGDHAFYRCTSLTSVVIGDGVTSIGDYAFGYCTSLKDVYYTGSEEQWNNITIGSGNSYLTGATKHFNYVKED